MVLDFRFVFYKLIFVRTVITHLQPLTHAWIILANTSGFFSFDPGAFRASNVSHTVVLRPLKAGYFNFTSASVSYLAQEGGEVVVNQFK